MLISDLLRYRDDLTVKLTQLSARTSISNDGLLLDILLHSHPDNPSFVRLQQAKDTLVSISKELDPVDQALIDVLNEINGLIDVKIQENFNQQALDSLLNYPNFDFIVSESVNQTIQACIRKHANHWYTALQFGCTPHSKILTADLVANDPLYLCDQSNDRIVNVSDQFNDIYNQRVRKYIVDQHDIQQLPTNQFGFILSWMLFNFVNYFTLKHYLEKFLPLLRPGGHFLFSYNNCDLLDSCVAAEIGLMSFVSKRNLIKACEEIGYEIVESHDIPNDDTNMKYISWLEIKKPGKLSTIKRRQVIGMIKT